MTDHAQSLLREALSLSEEERAGLIAELLISLEGPAEDDAAALERAWATELERRARRVLAGEATGAAGLGRRSVGRGMGPGA